LNKKCPGPWNGEKNANKVRVGRTGGTNRRNPRVRTQIPYFPLFAHEINPTRYNFRSPAEYEVVVRRKKEKRDTRGVQPKKEETRGVPSHRAKEIKRDGFGGSQLVGGGGTMVFQDTTVWCHTAFNKVSSNIVVVQKEAKNIGSQNHC